MEKATACPDDSTLRRFLLADLPEEEATRLEAHLLHCPTCCAAARVLRPTDALVEGLRGCSAASADAEGEAVAEVLGRLGPTSPFPEQTPMPAALDAQGGGGLPSWLSVVLAPAQEPGELGRLGPYRILQLLGGGGMGVVFLAEDSRRSAGWPSRS